MLSKEDCIAMSGLNADEICAIAEHEHIPEIAAAALGSYLLHQDHGSQRIRDIIVEDIREALRRNDEHHAAELFMALRHFLADHPEADLH